MFVEWVKNGFGFCELIGASRGEGVLGRHLTYKRESTGIDRNVERGVN